MTVVITRSPTTNAAAAHTPFTNPANAYTDDGLFATGQSTDDGTTDVPVDRAYGGFGFDSVLPTGIRITSVKVTIQSRRSALSANSINTVSASVPLIIGAPQTTRFGIHTDAIEQTWTFDHTTDRAWTRADLLDANFVLWLICANDSNNATAATANWEVDFVSVEVTYQEQQPGHISYVGGANAGNGGTSVTINVPTGTRNKDVMIAVIWCTGSDAPTPAGWTLLSTGLMNVSSYSLKVFRRVANNEPGSYNFAGGSSTFTFGYIDTFRGVDNGTPEDVPTPASNDNGVTGTITWPSITTFTQDAWHLAIVGDTSTIASIVGPAGYDVEGFGPVNTKASQTAARRISPAGTVSGVTATFTADSYTAISVALRPEFGGRLAFRRWPQPVIAR